MAKKGPKPKPSHLKALAGTNQPCRANEPAFDELQGEASLPAQFQTLREHSPILAAVVLEIWNDQLSNCRRRGQATADYSRALYQMCLLEALIHQNILASADVPMAMVNALRVYYGEFHLTPAGNVKPAGTPAGNRFANNGKPRPVA